MMTNKLAISILTSLLAVCTAMSVGASETQRAQAAANFIRADANADKALNLDEFRTLIDLNAQHNIGRAKMVKRLGKYSMAFGRMDANGDGLVTPSEISKMAARAKQ